MNETVSKDAATPKKDKIFTLIRILISLILLSLIVLKNYKNFQEIYQAMINVSLIFVFLAVLTHSGHILMNALRWNVLLRALSVRINLAFLYQTTFIGYFYNNLLPSNIGGDFYRIYDVYKNKDVPLNKSVSAVVTERFFSVISMIVYFAITSFSLYSILKKSIIIIAVFLFIAIILFIAVLRPKLFRIDKFFKRFKKLEKFEKKIESFNNAVELFKNKWPHIILGIFFTFAAQFLYMILYYSISLALGLDLKFTIFIFILPVIFVLTGIPISIGGLGVRENTIIFLLTRFGVSNEQAVVFSVLIMFEHLFTAGVGGVIYLFKNIFYKSKGFI